ncbi:MAG: ABC transporter permease [Lachnospiraceae bacterium]|nr:ABC transporter permease [Lachnospiraceae bacterium]
MKTAFFQAIELIFSGDRQLLQILSVTMKMSLSSSALALLIGVPIGVLLGSFLFKGRQIFIIINRTFMGLPPVVCGLFCYLLFSGVGPLRHLHLLYTVTGMVIAQVLLLTPLVIGNMEVYVSAYAPSVWESAKGLGLTRRKTVLLLMNEGQYQILSVYLLVFGRALAEVGAVSMVGGAIAFKTNVMTTAIMNYTNMGNFMMAMALGIILLTVSLILNIGAYIFQRRLKIG